MNKVTSYQITTLLHTATGKSPEDTSVMICQRQIHCLKYNIIISAAIKFAVQINANPGAKKLSVIRVVMRLKAQGQALPPKWIPSIRRSSGRSG
jgi:hypothetical protein